MKTSNRWFSFLFTGGLLATWSGLAAEAKPVAAIRLNPADVSLKLEVEAAIAHGLNWLATHQEPDGWWSRKDTPAISGLALMALQGDPAKALVGKHRDVVRKGHKFLLEQVKPDGGIYVENYPNYNTAVSMMALVASRNAEFDPVLRKARQYLVGLQSDFGEKGKRDDPFDGGIGYGSHGPHSDMSNTLLALEAIYYTKHLATDGGLEQTKDLDWEAVLGFIQNCQNLPSHNSQPWATGDPQDKGGFIYSPAESKVPEVKLPEGRIALRSYGSMSYAGLLSYVYADLKADDPRVLAVRDWLGRNYTLEENPGMGEQGLFYYFHTMAKALTAAQLDALPRKDAGPANWRRELALRLISLQAGDGSWTNANNRWMEKDPVLVTAYATLALEMIHRGW